MTDGTDRLKKEATEIVDKLKTKTAVTDAEIDQLQQHIDILEQAAQASHHHDHDSVKVQ
jgi:hypothetical protein